MTLAAGVRCGVYEITARIGAGGIGEVYRARDTKLGRRPEPPAQFNKRLRIASALKNSAKLLIQKNRERGPSG